MAAASTGAARRPLAVGEGAHHRGVYFPVLTPQPVEQAVHRVACGVATILGPVTTEEHGLMRRGSNFAEMGRARESALLTADND